MGGWAHGRKEKEIRCYLQGGFRPWRSKRNAQITFVTDYKTPHMGHSMQFSVIMADLAFDIQTNVLKKNMDLAFSLPTKAF